MVFKKNLLRVHKPYINHTIDVHLYTSPQLCSSLFLEGKYIYKDIYYNSLFIVFHTTFHNLTQPRKLDVLRFFLKKKTPIMSISNIVLYAFTLKECI